MSNNNDSPGAARVVASIGHLLLTLATQSAPKPRSKSKAPPTAAAAPATKAGPTCTPCAAYARVDQIKKNVKSFKKSR